MSKLSTLQRDSEDLINKWADASVRHQCPLMHHEYCAASKKGVPRKRSTIHTKQNKSCNRKAQRNHTHNVRFEYRYDKRYMQEESYQIADYVSAEVRRKKKSRKKGL